MHIFIFKAHISKVSYIFIFLYIYSKLLSLLFTLFSSNSLITPKSCIYSNLTFKSASTWLYRYEVNFPPYSLYPSQIHFLLDFTYLYMKHTYITPNYIYLNFIYNLHWQIHTTLLALSGYFSRTFTPPLTHFFLFYSFTHFMQPSVFVWALRKSLRPRSTPYTFCGRENSRRKVPILIFLERIVSQHVTDAIFPHFYAMCICCTKNKNYTLFVPKIIPGTANIT